MFSPRFSPNSRLHNVLEYRAKEGGMQQRLIRMIRMTVLVPAVLLSPVTYAQPQKPDTPYPTRAPLDQYLMADPDSEIALARSAAPKAISDNAEVLVLEGQGYRTAIRGSNGFACIVAIILDRPIR